MFTKLLLDGALKIVQVIRYKNKPATARIYDPRATTPEAILQESKYDPGRFIDDVTGKNYRNTPNGMIAI